MESRNLDDYQHRHFSTIDKLRTKMRTRCPTVHEILSRQFDMRPFLEPMRQPWETIVCPSSSAPSRTPKRKRVDIFDLCQTLSDLSDFFANGLICGDARRRSKSSKMRSPFERKE
uniref:Uncharacterized protein n=1 Tax=Pristionchus pacificus TaxID=54126 RepID=A0A8R1YZJ0_PRIPA